MTRPPFILAIGGIDNVGKSSQLDWLRHLSPAVDTLPGIHHFDKRWNAVGNPSANWWFEASSTSEHVALLTDSVMLRARHATELTSQLVVLDRGWHTILASCIATAMVKESLSLAAAVKVVGDLAPPHVPEPEILLQMSADVTQQATLSLSRETSTVDSRYERYQHAFSKVLALFAAEGRFAAIIPCLNRSLIDVQNDVRRAVSALTQSHIGAVGSTIERVITIGGLSESGKSSAAEYLRTEGGYTRLKIAHLVDIGSRLEQVKMPYELPLAQLAGVVAREMVRFADAHTDQRFFVLDSVHRSGLVLSLRDILGPRLTPLYVTAPSHIRRMRSRVPPAVFDANENLKHERGATAVAELADYVLDNSASQLHLRSALDAFRGVRCVQPRFTQAGRLGLAPELVAFLDQFVRVARQLKSVQMIATPGSIGSQSWVPGWSDLDLLVIGAGQDARNVFDAAQKFAPPNDLTAVSLTFFTPQEVDARLVPPRVVHFLRLLAAGDAPTLFMRQGWTPPHFSPSDDIRAAVQDLPVIAFRLRRLRYAIDQDADAFRGLFRHLVLFLKLLLRIDGVAAETASEVLVAASSHFAFGASALPTLETAVRGESFAVRQVTTATDMILSWYEVQTDRNLRGQTRGG